MLPLSYRKALRPHLSETQYLTLQLLVLLLQSHRQVCLGRLASLFPQPIYYHSRIRNLQRFLVLPQLSVRLLWFPILKYWLAQKYKGRHLNRQQRRRLERIKRRTNSYVVLALDRTQWRGRNLLMVTVVWDQHALPVYWEQLPQIGGSHLTVQIRLLKIAIKQLKSHAILVLGDREFHSPKLAKVLSGWGLDYCLRQKKSAQIQAGSLEYQELKTMGFSPGMRKFYSGIRIGKKDKLGPYNLAVYWKRKYRNRGGKEAWYILTSLPSLEEALKLYECRWGIEVMFKDYKSGGYNLEDAKVNDVRFLSLVLLIAIAYSLATCMGQFLGESEVDMYVSRPPEPQRQYRRHSNFGIGLYGYQWCYGMELWSEYAFKLISLKPHKQRYFQQGLRALSIIQTVV